MTIAKYLFYILILLIGTAAYAEFSVREWDNKRLVLRETLSFSYTELNETVKFDETGNYALQPGGVMTDQLSILFEFFKAGVNHDLQRMIELSDLSMRENLVGQSEVERNLMFSQYDSSMKNTALHVTHKFESSEENFIAYRIGIPLRRAELEGEPRHFYLIIAMSKLDQEWGVSDDLQREVGLAIRQNYPYTNPLYKVKRLLDEKISENQYED